MINDIGVEELKKLAEILTDALLHSANYVEPTLTEDDIETIDLDLISSCIAGITDPIGQLKDFLEDLLKSIADFIIGGVTGFIAGYVLPAIDSVLSTLLAGIDALSTSISDMWTSILDNISNMWRSIASSIDGVLTSLSTLISDVASTIQSSIASISTALSDFASSTITSLTNIMNSLTSGFTDILNTLASIGTSITEAFSNITSTLVDLGSAITRGFTDTLSQLTSTAESILSSISNMASTLGGAIADLGSTILTGVSDLINNLLTTISSAITDLTSFIGNMLSALSDALSGIASQIMSGISALGDAISNVGSFILEQVSRGLATISDTISGIASWLLEQTLAGISALGDAISGLGELLASGFKQILDGISAIPTAIQELAGAITKAFSDVMDQLTAQLGEMQATFLSRLGQLATGIDQWFTYATKVIYDMGEALQGVGAVLQGQINAILRLEPHLRETKEQLEDMGERMRRWFEGIEIPTWKVADWDQLTKELQELGKKLEQMYPPEPSLKGLAELGVILTDPYGWFTRTVPDVLSWVWDIIKSGFEWLIDILKGIAKELFGILTPLGRIMSETVSEGIQGLIEFSRELGDKIVKTIYAPVEEMFRSFVDIMGKKFPEVYKRIVEGKTQGEWFELAEIFLMLISSQFAFRMMSQVLMWIGENLDFKIFPSVSVKILGAGGEKTVEIPLKFGAIMKHLASEFREYPDTLMRATIYGFAIWFSRPISRLLNSLWRNQMPVELPSIPMIVETIRRHMSYKPDTLEPTEEFKKWVDTARFFYSLFGYSDFVIDWYFKYLKEEYVEVEDRFGVKRKFPQSLMHDLPSRSDLARMMVRDIILKPEEFTKAMQMVGMTPDLSYLYYLLHFRYPPPERLWEFVSRGISGLLWLTIPDEEKAELSEVARKIGAYPPIAPIEMNFKARKLLDGLKAYMKWHDYARFCVVEGTMILGDNKPIESYNVGDLTLYGGKVLATFKRPYRGKVIRIKARGLLELKLTPEHILPVVTGTRRWKLVKEDGRYRKRFILELSQPYFKRADEVKPAPKCRIQHKHSGDYLIVPRLEGKVLTRELDLERYVKVKTNVKRFKIGLDKDLAWLLGLYVAEGRSAEKYVAFGQSKKNLKVVERLCTIIRRLGYSPVIVEHKRKEGEVLEVYIKSPVLSRAFVEWCGKGARGKRIPDFILLHKDREILKAFLDGYLDGDGYVDQHYGIERAEICASTTSKVLAMQLQLALLRLGYIAGVNFVKHNETYIIRFIPRSHKAKQVIVLEDYALFPVQEVSYEDYEGFVYDLEVENHLYLVSNAIVHNSWIKDFPSDNLIYIDTLADIPTKIDQRWIVKWGLYELLSEKGITLKSPVKDFAEKIIENFPKSRITMDLTNFSRTLQATGLHPYWVPITAVAESINALTEERTLLRTGFINLFKEGFWNVDALEKLLAGFVVASFKVAYFDIATMQWRTGWINHPVMFLPAERKLLELRALMDRSLDILREIQRDISRGYEEWIIETYEEYKEKLTKVINSINEFFTLDYKAITGADLPDELKLTFVEEYYKPYVSALDIWRDIYTVRRIRYWTARWLGWLMYRIATGVVTSDDIQDVLSTIKTYAKLTSKEENFLNEIMSKISGIAVREYIPTPMMLATISEYMSLSEDEIDAILNARFVPEDWKEKWKKYIRARTLADDIRGLISSYRRALLYTTVPEELVQKVSTYAEIINFTEEEFDILNLRVALDELVLNAREYIPTPMMLATIGEYISLSEDEIDAVLDARRVPEAWKDKWKTYIRARVLADDIKGLISAYRRALLYVEIPEDVKKQVLDYAKIINFTEEERNILGLRVQLEQMVLESREYIPTPSMLATMSEYVVISEDLIDAVFNARRVPEAWRETWKSYISARAVADDIRGLLSAYRRALLYTTIPPEVEKKVDEYAKIINFTDREWDILKLRVQLEELIRQSREYIPTPMMLATICEYVPKAREFFDEVVKARRIPEEWREIWSAYVGIRPIINEMRRLYSRVEDMFVRFMITELDFKKFLEELKDVGYTDQEINLLFRSANYERQARAWRELIGDVDRMTMLAEYSPEARKFALGELYKMVDALPIDPQSKEIIKMMWEQFIRIKPIMSEVRSYVSELIRDFVEGIITEQEFVAELEELKKWGLDDYEIMFYKAIAGMRKARYLKRRGRG